MLTNTFRFASLLALGVVSMSASAQTSFYGGDPDLVEALSSELNTAVDGGLTYDDFTLGTGGDVTQMYGNFATTLTAAEITGLYYEIRSGVSVGDGGTLLYSGTMAPSVATTGVSVIGLDVLRVSGAPTGVSLQPGTYFMTVAVVDGGTGRAYLATTSGQGGVGAPLANGNSFFSSSGSSGDFFIPTSLPLGVLNSGDFSLGITTQAVPEPASLATLGLGAFALLRRPRAARA